LVPEGNAMMLAQSYKTWEGATKRARFENAFNERRGQFYWRVVETCGQYFIERITQVERAKQNAYAACLRK
jgi:hypothetical protein